jgi:TRAP transporter TAXI family solute receptor
MGFALAACLIMIGTLTRLPAATADWPKSLTLATASPGGVYYVFGEELARILTEKLGIAVDPAPTQGPVHNVQIVDGGRAHLGMTSMGVALQGWNGTGDWTNGKRFRNLRALFPMYGSPFQAVALRRSSITNLTQLDKKRVGVGPRAGTAGTHVPAILKALGISAEVNYGSYNAMASELIAGRIDAILRLGGAPTPAIQEAEARAPLTFISLTSEQIQIVLNAMPELGSLTMAAGTYRLLDKDYSTVGVFNFGIGKPDLPDDLVYQVVKAVFENQSRLAKSHGAADAMLRQSVDKNTFLPFHPGAARYYRDHGINIQETLVPTN